MSTQPPSTEEAVVLCAGLGRRLRPLTEHVPKALVEVRGRSLLEHHLEGLAQHGVRRAVLVVGHLGETVRERIGDGERFHLEVEYAIQPELLGTGDALRAARDQVRSDRFLVLYADVYFGRTPTVLRELLASDETTIVAAEVPDAGRFGRLETREEGRGSFLEGIAEKDGRPTPGLVNAGAYLFPGQIWTVLATLPSSPRGEVELTDGVMRLVRDGHRVRVVRAATWSDVGTPADLQRAQSL